MKQCGVVLLLSNVIPAVYCATSLTISLLYRGTAITDKIGSPVASDPRLTYSFAIWKTVNQTKMTGIHSARVKTLEMPKQAYLYIYINNWQGEKRCSQQVPRVHRALPASQKLILDIIHLHAVNDANMTHECGYATLHHQIYDRVLV